MLRNAWLRLQRSNAPGPIAASCNVCFAEPWPTSASCDLQAGRAVDCLALPRIVWPSPASLKGPRRPGGRRYDMKATSPAILQLSQSIQTRGQEIYHVGGRHPLLINADHAPNRPSQRAQSQQPLGPRIAGQSGSTSPCRCPEGEIPPQRGADRHRCGCGSYLVFRAALVATFHRLVYLAASRICSASKYNSPPVRGLSDEKLYYGRIVLQRWYAVISLQSLVAVYTVPQFDRQLARQTEPRH